MCIRDSINAEYGEIQPAVTMGCDPSSHEPGDSPAPAFQALQPYVDAFHGDASQGDAPFLHYHSISADKSLATSCYTRAEFWAMASKAAGVLRSRGIAKGMHQLHYFSKNTVEDMAFRLGAGFLGSIPVTVNWQADSLERIAYKADITEARICLVDSGTNEEHVAALRGKGLEVFNVGELSECAEVPSSQMDPSVGPCDTKMVIFTSGTTGHPKGVKTDYRAYDTNRRTFESFLKLEDPRDGVIFVLMNPLHHTNSSAISDWAIRRPGAVIHLSERYSTAHWAMLEGITSCCSEATRVICPMVAKHFDFLEALIESDKLAEIGTERLEACLRKAEPTIGSAPVGPTTCLLYTSPSPRDS
eukprot:TRINITY_DN7436_c0_g1_i1.p1 TRINITY_DN7436_c0_g1~~TRINITY_DN7436_c0_g1_i1.p1  ORF type:complete len:359 (-),score=75.81 TRINITY_DN7436_c0_g1_i1:97-1173(-)